MRAIVLRCTEQVEVNSIDPVDPIGAEFEGHRFAVMLSCEQVWGLLNSKCSEMDTHHELDCHRLLRRLLNAGYKLYVAESYKELFTWLTEND